MLKLLIVILILLVAYLYFPKKEEYEYFKAVKEDTTLEEARKQVTKDDWTVYTPSKVDNGYVLTPFLEKAIVYQINIDKNIYSVTGKNKKDLKIGLTQENLYTPSATGNFIDKSVKITYSRGTPTFSVIMKGEAPIIGQVSETSSYSDP